MVKTKFDSKLRKERKAKIEVVGGCGKRFENIDSENMKTEVNEQNRMDICH